MTEQEKREKVIKGLEEVQHYIKVENLPAHTLKAKLVIDDALAMLKAQEPRVMTLEEVKANKICWIEDKDAEMIYPAIYQCRGNGMFCVFSINPVYDVEHGNEDVARQFDEGERWLEEDDLNRWWRPWASRPTDAQREAIPWQG